MKTQRPKKEEIPKAVAELDPKIWGAPQFGPIEYEGHSYKPVLVWEKIA